MKIRLLSLACVAVLAAACSSPKMAYKFDYHDYNAGRKAKDVKEEVASNPGVMPVQPGSLVAMETVAETSPVVVAEGKTYEEMTRKERKSLKREFKEIRKELKKDVKEIVKKEKKDGVLKAEASKALDRDLKLAAIFGAVGIVGLILGGASYAFWIIGGIALIIGVVFFVKWLVRQ